MELDTPKMSHEEMIDTLKWLVFGTFDRTTVKEREALDMAIALLEQKPCDDCVSRQAVLDLCDSKDPDYKVIHFKEDVECLPSVTPQQKMGKWIESHIPESTLCECSVCGFSCGAYSFNFCPNCGAKMEEGE